jgi:hypothetical protein
MCMSRQIFKLKMRRLCDLKKSVGSINTNHLFSTVDVWTAGSFQRHLLGVFVYVCGRRKLEIRHYQTEQTLLSIEYTCGITIDVGNIIVHETGVVLASRKLFFTKRFLMYTKCWPVLIKFFIYSRIS